MNMGFNQTLVPGGFFATQQFPAPPRQTQPMMQGTIMPWPFGCMGQDSGRIRSESSCWRGKIQE